MHAYPTLVFLAGVLITCAALVAVLAPLLFPLFAPITQLSAP